MHQQALNELLSRVPHIQERPTIQCYCTIFGTKYSTHDITRDVVNVF